MSNYRGTVIKLKPGLNAPEAFWDKAIADLKANVYGLATVVNGTLFTQSFQGAPTVEGINGIRAEEFLPPEMYIYLGNHPEGSDKQDILPWVVHAEDDENMEVMALMADGDFSKFSHSDQQRSDQYYWYENVALPNIAELCELLDGDISKVMTKMKARPRETAFLDSMLTGGDIFILAMNGDVQHYSKNSKGREFEWGYTTNTHGHIETADEDEDVEVVEKTLSPAELMRQKLAAKMGGGGKKEELPFVPDKAPPTVLKTVDGGKKEDLKSTTVQPPKPDLVEVKVPHDTRGWSNEKIKGFLNSLLGHVPTGWKNMKTIMIPRDKWDKYSNKKTETLKSLQELVPLTEGHPAATDTTTKNIPPEAAQTASKTPVAMDRPTIPQTQLQEFDKKFLTSVEMKAIKSKQQGLITPDELQAMEAKCPSFSELVLNKLTLEESFRIDRAGRLVLIKEYPHIAAALFEVYLIGAIKNHLRVASESEDNIEVVERKTA